MIVTALSVELDWNQRVRPGQGRVVVRWGDKLVYAFQVTDREAAWLCDDENLEPWFAERLGRVFVHVFGPDIAGTGTGFGPQP